MTTITAVRLVACGAVLGAVCLGAVGFGFGVWVFLRADPGDGFAGLLAAGCPLLGAVFGVFFGAVAGWVRLIVLVGREGR